MSTSSSPAFSHSTMVDEALTRSAKISKVILDISRNLEPDSHLDAIWQRLHSGDANYDGIDNPEPFSDAPTRSNFPKSLVLSSPVNSRTMSVCRSYWFVAFNLNDKDVRFCQTGTRQKSWNYFWSSEIPNDTWKIFTSTTRNQLHFFEYQANPRSKVTHRFFGLLVVAERTEGVWSIRFVSVKTRITRKQSCTCVFNVIGQCICAVWNGCIDFTNLCDILWAIRRGIAGLLIFYSVETAKT